MLEKPKERYFTHIKGTNFRNIFLLLMFQQLLVNNITGCVIQSPKNDLAEATDANCVIRILAERSLVQPTEKKKINQW